jgi:putative ABC transport system permease protein
MAPLATLAVAVQSLRRHPLRSVLATGGIVVGVAAVVAMVALGRGAQHAIDGYLRAIGSNVLVLMPASTRSSGVHLGAGSTQVLTEDDARAIGEELDAVAVAAPIIRATRQLVSGARNWSTTVYATTNAYFDARDWDVEVGRGFTDEELARAGRVMVLGRRVVHELFGADATPEEALGATVRIRLVPFVVVGVLAEKGQHMGGQDADDAAFVPLATGRVRVFGPVRGRANLVHTVLVKVHDGPALDDVKDEVLRLVRQRHGLPQDARDERFTLIDLTEQVVARRESARTTSWLLAAIAGTSLLVGGIGIMNVMLVAVTERTREIGLRMAVGGRPRDILSQFLVEACVVAAAGGAAGLALGALAAGQLGARLGWATPVEAPDFALAVGVAAAVGVLAGVYPALRAARLQPVAALRHE